MGKRSSFERNPKDFYETPRKAVVPLIPHLPDRCNYVDPCFGEGAIMQHLAVLHPHSLAWGTYDKYPEKYKATSSKADATTQKYNEPINCFITNPPWSIDVLHPVIDNLASQKPTWLLFYADWMHTKQAIPYLKYCVKIVSIGRVSWMGNGVSGMDNCCWYLFDKSFEGQTQLIGRAA